MGNRLSKIVTRTGDGGETGLGDGSRTTKDSCRIVAIGEVDELNSAIGLLLSSDLPENLRSSVEEIQHDLFDLGGELCMPGVAVIQEAQVERLESLASSMNTDLPMLKDFILPGGCQAACFSHLARSVCRRAERAVVVLGRQENVSSLVRKYLNRLSDVLFIMARVLNKEAGRSDVLWKSRRS